MSMSPAETGKRSSEARKANNKTRLAVLFGEAEEGGAEKYAELLELLSLGESIKPAQKEFMNRYERLFEYMKPKLARSEQTVEVLVSPFGQGHKELAQGGIVTEIPSTLADEADVEVKHTELSTPRQTIKDLNLPEPVPITEILGRYRPKPEGKTSQEAPEPPILAPIEISSTNVGETEGEALEGGLEGEDIEGQA